jgi:hypothetical protein
MRKISKKITIGTFFDVFYKYEKFFVMSEEKF